MTETRTILIDLYNVDRNRWMLCDTEMETNQIPASIRRVVRETKSETLLVEIDYGLTNNSFDHEEDSWEIDEALISEFSIGGILFRKSTLTKTMRNIILDYAVETSYYE